jgi:hypothetical protein
MRISKFYETTETTTDHIRTDRDFVYSHSFTSEESKRRLDAARVTYDPISNNFFDANGRLIRPSVIEEILKR